MKQLRSLGAACLPLGACLPSPAVAARCRCLALRRVVPSQSQLLHITPKSHRSAVPATILQLLEALPAHFGGVARAQAAAVQAEMAVGELIRLTADADAQAGLSANHSRLER